MEPEIRHIPKNDFAKHRVIRSDGEVTIDGVYPTREAGFYMIRTRIPGGLITLEQAESLARLAVTYANGIWHIDTRANVEFHGVSEADVLPFVEALETTGLTTRGACGDSVRNIVFGSEGNLRHADRIQALVENLTRQYSGVPEFETLPRKFKIAFFSADDREPLHRINDLGFVESSAEGKPLSFDVWIGGKLGKEPRLGDLLVRNLPETDVAGLVLAAVQLHDELSNRKNRTRARFSFVLNEYGVDEIRNRLLERWSPSAQVDLVPRVAAIKAHSRLATTGVHVLADGRFRVRVPVVAGDLTSQEVLKLVKIARRAKAESIQLSVRQNLSLIGILASDVTALVEDLTNLGYAPSGWSGAKDIVACPGSTNCRKGFVETHSLARSVSDSLLKANAPEWAKRVRVSLSGCPNSCSHPQLYDLGFRGNAGKIGTEVLKGYDLLLGGRLYGRTLLGRNVASLVGPSDVTATVQAFAELFGEHGRANEPADAFIDRVGVDGIAEFLSRRVTLEQGEWRSAIDTSTHDVESAHPREVLRWALKYYGDELLVTSALGAGGVLLVQWLAEISPKHPVYFVDTGKHFPETMSYLRELQRFGLNIESVGPGFSEDEFADIYGDELWQRDADLCCTLRKLQVVQRLRRGKRAWISAIRREQGGERATISVVQEQSDATFKISPLAGWTREQIDEELRIYGIPQHPLTRQGYASIGCGPCTLPSSGSERDGRWAGLTKTECGLHGQTKQELKL